MSADELREAARGLLSSQPFREADAARAWRLLVDAGWPSLCVTEANGGLGQPLTQARVLFEELGRTATPNPLLSAFPMACALDFATNRGSEDARERLADLVDKGRFVAGVCFDGDPAATAGDCFEGRWPVVPDAVAASHLLVRSVDASGRFELRLVATDAPGCLVRPASLWDESRSCASVELRSLELRRTSLVLAGPDAIEAFQLARTVFDAAMAADAVGGAAFLLDETIGYTKSRVQFGRPIASFQAVKHRCADLATEIAAAKALLRRAFAAIDARSPRAAALASMARLCAGDVYLRTSEEAIQLHGGIGFTWDHRCHRYLKRARSAEVLGGTRAARQDALVSGLRAALLTAEH